MHRTLIFLLLPILLLAGCSTAFVIPRDRSTLMSAKAPRELKQDFAYPISTGLAGIGSIKGIGLAAGVYAPVFDDAEGTYYRGPDWCVRLYRESAVTEPWFFKDGGIWIPKDPQGRARIFSYVYERRYASGGVPGNSATTSVITANTVHLSSVQAGVAGGVAAGILSAMDASADRNQVGRWPPIPVVDRLEEVLFSPDGLAAPVAAKSL